MRADDVRKHVRFTLAFSVAWVMGTQTLAHAMPLSGDVAPVATHAASFTVPVVGAATSADRGLCQVQETVYFACPTTRSRWISLCGSPGTLQYRFGRQAKIEFMFPPSAAEGASQLRYADYFRQQVTRTEVSFESDGTDYAVYDYLEENRHTAGVRVTTPEGKEVDIACKGPANSQLSKLKSVIPCDKESALNGGQCNR